MKMKELSHTGRRVTKSDQMGRFGPGMEAECHICRYVWGLECDIFVKTSILMSPKWYKLLRALNHLIPKLYKLLRALNNLSSRVYKLLRALNNRSPRVYKLLVGSRARV